MSVQLPEKPWTKGMSFKVEATGIEYVYDGSRWLSDGVELPEDLATVDYVDSECDKKLDLSGGTVDGTLVLDQSGGPALQVKKNGTEKFRIEQGGRAYTKYDLSLDHAVDTIVTRGYVQQQLEENAISGPTNYYDGDYTCVVGNATTSLDIDQLVFLNKAETSAQDLENIAAIAFSFKDFPWSKCSFAGNIKISQADLILGVFTIYDYKIHAGRNVVLFVTLAAEGTASHVYEGSDYTCSFRGVFFK